MPAKSRAFQRLAGAAEHGASFPMAKKLRASMTHQQLHDFASGSMKGKPEHVRIPKAHGTMRTRPGTQSTRPGTQIMKRSLPHPHRNLGQFLHPSKKGY